MAVYHLYVPIRKNLTFNRLMIHNCWYYNRTLLTTNDMSLFYSSNYVDTPFYEKKRSQTYMGVKYYSFIFNRIMYI